MTYDPPAITLEPDYASALGAAVYAFASLEWNAVICCERLEPGSMDDLSERTAGRVADTLLSLARKHEPALVDAASDFEALVATRNNLVHARPGTTAAGLAGLFRHGDEWTQEELRAVAGMFEACAARLAT